MKIGVVFPQTEIGADKGAVRLYAEAVSDLGYDHILAYDHVVGADTECTRAGTAPMTCERRFTSQSSFSASWPLSARSSSSPGS